MWLSTSLLLLILISLISCSVNKPVRNKHESLIYLNKYGYNSCLNSSKKSVCSVNYSSMLRDFQKRYGVKKTGVLDASTKRVMNLPRCGNSDAQSSISENFKWSRSSLTWSLRSYPRQISKARVTAIIHEAFNSWITHIPVQIKEACSTCSADILIDFERYNHNCSGGTFNGPGTILAHTFLLQGRRIHFNANEQWTEM